VCRILLELERELAEEVSREPMIPELVLVGVARAGLPDQKCVAGSPEELERAEWPPPPQTLVVTAPRLHPVEAEALKTLCGCRRC
jgi:diphthine synthase